MAAAARAKKIDSDPAADVADVRSDVVTYDGLDRVLGFHLRQAQGAMHRGFIATLEEFDLTQKQTGVFWLVGANPGVSQIALSGALGMDRATIMSIVDRLEDRGFVVRERSKIDRRRQELYLTPEGKAALTNVKAKIHGHEQRHEELFSEAELATLIDFLRRLYTRRGAPPPD